MSPLAQLTLIGLAGVLTGCGDSQHAGEALVLTQIPRQPIPIDSTRAPLDVRHPPGSRVILALSPFGPDNVRVLSSGLLSAGSPIVSAGGKQIFFAGKADASSAWQIYEARLNGGAPRAVTAVDEGAMDPALLPDGSLVFSSPVPRSGAARASSRLPALYAQSQRGSAHRLTFGTTDATDPIVLADGRILFVSAQPSSQAAAALHQSLFTVNSDGTELTAYAGQHDGMGFIAQPRELLDGRVAFLAADTAFSVDSLWAETVRTARPFLSRGKLFPATFGTCRSVGPGASGELLASLKPDVAVRPSTRRSYAIYQISRTATVPDKPLFDDPNWDDIEAALVAPRLAPMGHLSTVDPTRTTGLLLCMDANRTDPVSRDGNALSPAVRVRFLGLGEAATVRSLGEIPVQADGSFLAEVPADVPLGFETVDAQGQTLLRLPPSIWVRPGETHSCPGCHAPHGRALENHRPLAVLSPPARIGALPRTLAKQSHP